VLARQGRFHSRTSIFPRAGRWNQFWIHLCKIRTRRIVVVDMRVLVTDDTVKWLAKLCQRERVGGRPIGDDKNVGNRFQKVRGRDHTGAESLIITVSCRCAGIRVLKRSARFRAKARGIVARDSWAAHHAACRYPSFPDSSNE